MSSRAMAERPVRQFKSNGHAPSFRQNFARDRQRVRERGSAMTSTVNGRPLVCGGNNNIQGWRGDTQSAESMYGYGILTLHHEMRCFFRDILPKAEDHRMRERIVNDISLAVYEVWPEAKVEVFGSFKTGLYLPTSDIDLVIVGGFWDTLPLYALRDLLEEKGFCQEIKVINTASVPIIKLVHKLASIKVDIGFNIPNVRNSAKLIKGYAKSFPVFPCLVMTLKQFLAQEDLNEVYTGGLSSYSLCLMLISFLQTHPRNEGRSPSANCGALLLEFLYVYGLSFDYNTRAISVTHEGSIPRNNAIAHQGTVSILDPFCPGNDVARGSYNFARIRSAFSSAFQLLYISLCMAPYWNGILARIVRLPTVASVQRARRRSSASKNSISSPTSVQHSSSSSPDSHTDSNKRDSIDEDVSSASFNDTRKNFSTLFENSESPISSLSSLSGKSAISGSPIASVNETVTEMVPLSTASIKSTIEATEIKLSMSQNMKNSQPDVCANNQHVACTGGDNLPQQNFNTITMPLPTNSFPSIGGMTSINYFPRPVEVRSQMMLERGFAGMPQSLSTRPAAVLQRIPYNGPHMVPVFRPAFHPSLQFAFSSPIRMYYEPLKSNNDLLISNSSQTSAQVKFQSRNSPACSVPNGRLARSSSVPCLDRKLAQPTKSCIEEDRVTSEASSSPPDCLANVSPSTSVVAPDAPLHSTSLSYISSQPPSVTVAGIPAFTNSGMFTLVPTVITSSYPVSCIPSTTVLSTSTCSGQYRASPVSSASSSSLTTLDDIQWPRLSVPFLPPHTLVQTASAHSPSTGTGLVGSRSDTVLYLAPPSKSTSGPVVVSAWHPVSSHIMLSRTYSQACLKTSPTSSGMLERTLSLDRGTASSCRMSAKNISPVAKVDYCTAADEGAVEKYIQDEQNSCESIVSSLHEVSLR